MNGNEVILAIAAVAALAFLVILVLFFSVVRIWIQGLLSGVPVSILDVIGMRLRRSPPDLIVRTAIVLRHRGQPASLVDIEAAYLGFGSGVTSPDELADLVLQHYPPGPKPGRTPPTGDR